MMSKEHLIHNISMQEKVINYLKSNNIVYRNVTESMQGQLHQWFFIDKKYYLKIYNDENSFNNALQNGEFGPAMINHGKIENKPCILFDQIKWVTVAELLCSLPENDKKIVFTIITQLLKEIHTYGIKKHWKPLIHWDFHIGNIIVSGDFMEIDNYHVIDRDMSHYGDYKGEYGVIIETIVAPSCMVGEELEDQFEDKDLLLRWNIIHKVYPEFIQWNIKAIKEEWMKRANIKFEFKNGTNERANRIWKSIISFLNSIDEPHK